MTRIAVTGAGGFLGQALITETGKRGIDAVPISLPRTSQVLERAFHKELLEKIRPDVVIHCAAVLRPNNDKDFAVNVRLPVVMAEALSEVRPTAAFVHVSSLNVLQESRLDAYTQSKRQAEDALTGLDVAIVRPGLIWSWINKGGAAQISAYLKRPLPFHPVPFPGPRFRPLLIDVFASAVVDLAVGGDIGGKRINACGDSEWTLWDLISALSKMHGGRPVPLPTGLIEHMLPKPVLGRLPIPLRSFAAVDDGILQGRDGDQALILPFTGPPDESAAQN